MVYLDEMLVYIDSWDQHIRLAKLVPNRSRKHKSCANLSKRTFEVEEFDYNGFVLGATKLATNPNEAEESKYGKIGPIRKNFNLSSAQLTIIED